MKIQYAREIAIAVKAKLAPFCDRIEIAGSIRRGGNRNEGELGSDRHVNDIEVVCIPKLETERKGLFDGAPEGPQQVVKGFADAVNEMHKVKGDPTGRYTRRLIRAPHPQNKKGENPLYEDVEIALDLFMCKANNWGWIYLVRTGSRDFSHQAVIELQKRGYTSHDGVIHTISTKEVESRPIDTPEESDVFALIGCRFVDPVYRDTAAFLKGGK